METATKHGETRPARELAKKGLNVMTESKNKQTLRDRYKHILLGASVCVSVSSLIQQNDDRSEWHLATDD